MKTLILLLLFSAYVQAERVLTLTIAIEGFYNGNTMVGDTVQIYLREDDSPFQLRDSAKAFVNSNGVGIFLFNNISNNSDFRIVVKHRNSLETWSNEVFFTNDVLSYNFITSASQAYGNNLKLKGNKYCIYSGDCNQDGMIDGADIAIVGNATIPGGSLIADLNGDGIVNSFDLAIVDNNVSEFVLKIIPPYENINFPVITIENATINGIPANFIDCDNLIYVSIGDVIELDWVSTDIDIIEEEGELEPDEVYDTVYFSPLFNGTLIFTPPILHEGHSPLRTHMFLTTNVPYPPDGYFQEFGYARIESYDEANNSTRCFLNFIFE